MVTGYYEPLLRGSRTRTRALPRAALRACPTTCSTIDLAELYPDLKDKRAARPPRGQARRARTGARATSSAARRRVAGKELAWVDDPVEAFFLQIQGSGRVELADGGACASATPTRTAIPIRSIGRLLIERGELPLEQASMQGIKDWGRRNPDKLPALLDENPSYVFFREVPAAPGTLEAEIDGPIGTLGVPLLARAHDRRRSARRSRSARRCSSRRR